LVDGIVIICHGDLPDRDARHENDVAFWNNSGRRVPEGVLCYEFGCDYC
jgi:hypothetical protein